MQCAFMKNDLSPSGQIVRKACNYTRIKERTQHRREHEVDVNGGRGYGDCHHVPGSERSWRTKTQSHALPS